MNTATTSTIKIRQAMKSGSRKLVSVLLLISLVVTVLLPVQSAFAAGLDDVKNAYINTNKQAVAYRANDEVSEDKIEPLSSDLIICELFGDHNAYINGYPEGDVRPGNNITRAEVATVLCRLVAGGFNLSLSYWTQTKPFLDVKEDDWYNNAITVMYNAGIVKGYPDGTFKPNNFITRAEFTALAVRFDDMQYGRSDENLGFSDISSHWAQKDIILTASIGWVSGYSDGTFKPNKEITRAEFMTIINRMYRRVPQTLDDLIASRMVTWSDNADPNAWYYLAVQEATNSHAPEYKKETVPEGSFRYERWGRMIENPDWSAQEQRWANKVQ